MRIEAHVAVRRRSALLAGFLLCISALFSGKLFSPAIGGAMALHITSPDFSEGEAIPKKFTCDAQDVSPKLEWNEPPANTESFALIMDDPDAPAGTWVHWVLYDLPADAKELPERVPRQAAPLFLQAVRTRYQAESQIRCHKGRPRTRHERSHPCPSRTDWQIRSLMAERALTGEGKAAILASDDWPASRTARRKKTEPSARGRGRRGLPRAGAAFDLRGARRAAHRSDPPDPHPCAGRCAGAVRVRLRARKAFF